MFSQSELKSNPELREILGRIERGIFPSIEFELDSDVIRADSFLALDAIAYYLLKNQNIKIRISAHTCNLGDEDDNQELSDLRARSVADYLIKRGVPPPSIRWKGWGSAHPVADNSTEEGRKRNRRVEFHILRNDWESVY